MINIQYIILLMFIIKISIPGIILVVVKAFILFIYQFSTILIKILHGQFLGDVAATLGSS